MPHVIMERILTGRPQDELLKAIEIQLGTISKKIQKSDGILVATEMHVANGFWLTSSYAKDQITVTTKKADGGWLVVAEVQVIVTFTFIVYFLVGVFTAVLWIIPLLFYFIHRRALRQAVEGCLHNLKTELDQAPGLGTFASSASLGDLEKLADLKAKGIITPEEFEAKKKQLLGL